MEDILNWIKQYFAEDNFYRFTDAWRRAHYLYSHIIPKEYPLNDELIAWLEVDPTGINWSSNYEIKKRKDSRGQDYFDFQCDITVKGKVGYIAGLSEIRTDVSYSLTLKAFLYDGMYAISPDNVKLWTKQQKALNDYNDVIAEQYIQLGLNEFDSIDQTNYTSFISIWTKGDKGNKEQSENTSYYFYREIIDAYDQLRFCIANVNAYLPYTSNYLERETHMAGQVLYDINLTMFDRRYLYFCGIAFEKLYSFWERIAFLAYQFIQPTELKNLKNLSFSKFISTLGKDCAKGLYPTFNTPNSCYNWFVDFEQNHHRAIQKYRHSLIHYKNQNEIHKGSYFAGTHSYWIKNASEKEKIVELQTANRDLALFLIAQIAFCKTGFENLIGLIKELPDKSPPELPT